MLWPKKITLYSEPSAVASLPSVASAMPLCALHSTRQPKSKQPRQRSAAAVPRLLANLLCCELMAYSENCLALIATKSLQKADESSPPYWLPATLMLNNLPRSQLKNPRENGRSSMSAAQRIFEQKAAL